MTTKTKAKTKPTTRTKPLRVVVGERTDLKALHSRLRADGTQEIDLNFLSEVAEARFARWMTRNGYDRRRGA